MFENKKPLDNQRIKKGLCTPHNSKLELYSASLSKLYELNNIIPFDEFVSYKAYSAENTGPGKDLLLPQRN